MSKIKGHKIVKGGKITPLKGDNNSLFSDLLHRLFDICSEPIFIYSIQAFV